MDNRDREAMQTGTRKRRAPSDSGSSRASATRAGAKNLQRKRLNGPAVGGVKIQTGSIKQQQPVTITNVNMRDEIEESGDMI